MHRTWAPMCLALGLVPAVASADGDGDRHLDRTHCDVAIIGGGPGGLHSAYRLGPQLHGKVCLFEKNDRLGGRIYDVPRTPGGPVFATGARRIMEGQTVVFNLAAELGITYEPGPWRDDLLSARGHFAYNSDDINALAYPLVSDAETETTLYDKLRFGPERKNIGRYPDFRSYVRAVVGTQGYHYLTDVFRFRADFEATLDARGYLDYLDEEWDVCCTPYYPIGGMSEFIRRMEQKTLSAGVRIYKSEPALEISRVAHHRYAIRTPRQLVTANRVIIAADAEAFKHVGGDVAQAIQRQGQFQDLVGIKVVTIAQWWPRSWWVGAKPGKDIRRAWTTEHCLNAMEMPTTPYVENQNVTRTVYDDGMRCVQFWENTAARGIPAVEAEIARGLAYLFPGVSIPRPLKTFVQVWPAGWYWLRGGSPFTNKQIAQWAIEPLAGEDVSLVGEAYNPQRSGWSDGAYKSSINTLNARYGFTLPGATIPEAMLGVAPAPAAASGRAARRANAGSLR